MRLLIMVALAACGGHTNPTPAGTRVLAWDISRSDRAALRTATFANLTSKDLALSDADTGVTLALHLELARATYSEDGTAMALPVVVSLAATVTDANAFTLADGRCAGPDYDLALPATTTLIDCTVGATRPDSDLRIFFQLDGSGSQKR